MLLPVASRTCTFTCDGVTLGAGGVLSPNVRSWLTRSSAPGPGTSVTFGLLGSGTVGSVSNCTEFWSFTSMVLNARINAFTSSRVSDWSALMSPEHVVGDLDREEGVAQALADRDAGELADEVLLARDAVEVGAHVEQPPALARIRIEDRAVRVEDLHVPRPDVFERLAAVERDAPGAVGDVEPGLDVAHGTGDVHADLADRVDDVLEALEVDLDVVVDVDVEVVLQRVDDQLRATDSNRRR